VPISSLRKNVRYINAPPSRHVVNNCACLLCVVYCFCYLKKESDAERVPLIATSRLIASTHWIEFKAIWGQAASRNGFRVSLLFEC